MKYPKFVAIAFLLAFVSGCTTHVPMKRSPFIRWEQRGEMHSFDKAGSYSAIFIAETDKDNLPSIRLDDRNLEYTSMGLVQEYSNITAYKVKIPGPLIAGEHRINAKQTIGEHSAEDSLTLIVHPTRLATFQSEDGEKYTNEEEVTGLIKSLSKGDAVEFCAVPGSGFSIPEHQFRTIIKGTKQERPLIGLHVRSSDNYYIGPDADNIKARIIWQDPNDQSVSVQLFPTDGSEYLEAFPGLKRPRIICGEISRITDDQDPIFFISCEVKTPIYEEMTTTIKDVKFEIMEQGVKGYKVISYGRPQLVNGTWQMGFKLDGPLPLPRGTGGTIKIRVKAKAATTKGEESPEAVRSCRFNIVY